MGFAKVAALPSQTRFDAAIQSGGHQGFSTLLGGIHQHAAVGGKTGAFIGVGVGQRGHLTGGQLHQVQAKTAGQTRHISKPTAVRADGGDRLLPR